MINKMKDLDKLIEQILLERFPSPYEKEEFVTAFGEPISVTKGPATGTQSASAIFDTMAAIRPETNLLDKADLEYLVSHPEEIDVQRQARLIAITQSKIEDVELKTLARTALNALAAEIERSSREKQTTTAPEIQPQKATMTGTWPPHMTAIVEKVFSNISGTDFKSRIKVLSEISINYFEAASDPTGLAVQKLQQLQISELLSQVMLLDIFNLVVKDFDAGSGGYLFEYLLAMIAGGKVTGQGMGAVDFRSADGKAGSSKYYEKGAGMYQALTGFTLGETVQYICAIKKQDRDQLDKLTRGTSGPNKITTLDIYSFDIRVERCHKKNKFCGPITVGKENQLVTIFVNEKPIHFKQNVTKNSLSIDNQLKGNRVGPIILAKLRTESFRMMAAEAIGNLTDIQQESFNAFMKFFDCLTIAKTSSKKYAASGDEKAAEEALDGLSCASREFEVFTDAIYYEKYVPKDSRLPPEKSTPSSGLAENNINQLDKLIERVILDKMED